MTRRDWTVRLADTAEADYDETLRWTVRRSGAMPAAAYGRSLAAALVRLQHGPTVAVVRKRDDIGKGVRTLHVGRHGRHVILFRIGSEHDRTIDVLRVSHDAMDLARQVRSAA